MAAQAIHVRTYSDALPAHSSNRCCRHAHKSACTLGFPPLYLSLCKGFTGGVIEARMLPLDAIPWRERRRWCLLVTAMRLHHALNRRHGGCEPLYCADGTVALSSKGVGCVSNAAQCTREQERRQHHVVVRVPTRDRTPQRERVVPQAVRIMVIDFVLGTGPGRQCARASVARSI